MSRQIFFHGDHFLDFYKGLDIKVKEKIQYVFELIKQVDRVPEKFFATMTGYKGLYEYGLNICRISIECFVVLIKVD